jgi:chromosome segregation ATPase
MTIVERPDDDAIAVSVAELRGRFPRTQDLYREVCVLLFFRHGITPTANRLYQLVRKGSMSTPTEALNQFWNTLRERSRVTIGHADLPEELQEAAGSLLATLWKSAQTISLESLTNLRAEVARELEVARADQIKAREAYATVATELEKAHARVHTSEELVKQLREELAAAAATADGLGTRLQDARELTANLQLQLDQARKEQVTEREKLAERTHLAEQRFSAMEKRAMVEIDRERTSSSRLRKLLESERATHATASERLRIEQNELQRTIGSLREQIGSLGNNVDTLTKERDLEHVQLESLRSLLEETVRRAAADGARANQLQEELKHLRATSGQALSRSKRARRLKHASKS